MSHFLLFIITRDSALSVGKDNITAEVLILVCGEVDKYLFLQYTEKLPREK